MLFPAAATAAPIQFGPYLLTECVGQGGMAVVYKATRQGPSGFAKTVVVKAMLPTLSAQREFVAMFSAEARLMAQLEHPNIVQVQDFGVVDGIPYLVMEYLPGRNLSQLRTALQAARVKLPVGAALTIAREMCHGLGFAHGFVDEEGKKRRVIHRDVSPSNVMVCRDGSVKLLDFGVAKIVGEFEFDVTQTLKGKYAYMAPEQVSHKPIDCRVDVFAAGVVLHELLTGKRLFAANTELETLQRVQSAQVIAPSVDNKEVPRALDAIVKRALAKNPNDRYATGAELAEALESLDALSWSRKRVAGLMADLFAHEWMIVCEVCGKRVMPGSECLECGTRAPDGSAPVEVQNVAPVDAKAALMPIVHTDRNVVVDEPSAAGPMPALPPTASEPLPLPPPPVTPLPRRPPKILPNSETPRAHLQVVRTPVPPPLGDAAAPSLFSDAQPATDPETVSPLVSGEIENDVSPMPGPPRLFVVPQPDPAATAADVTPAPEPLFLPGVNQRLLVPRPAAPQPLFVLPSAPLNIDVRPRRGPSLVIGGLVLLAIALFGVVALVQEPPRPEPSVTANVEATAASAPAAEPTHEATQPAATSPAPPMNAQTAASLEALLRAEAQPQAGANGAAAAQAHEPAAQAHEPAAQAHEPAAPQPPQPPSLSVAPPAATAKHAPARHHRPTHSRVAAPADDRSINEGRLVDPFAEVK